MVQTEYERKFFISKDILDTINSVAWFFADALWMLEFLNTGLFLMIPTILSGFCLLYVEKRKPITIINISINCWIWMNFLWMLADTNAQTDYHLASKIFFFLGVFFIFLAAYYSESIRDTFSHFRRFRGRI